MKEIITSPNGRRWRVVHWLEKGGGQTAIATEMSDELVDTPLYRSVADVTIYADERGEAVVEEVP